MEWRAGEGAIRLFNDDDINGTRKGCCVDFIVEVSKVADELSNVVHAVHSELVRVRPGYTCLQ